MSECSESSNSEYNAPVDLTYKATNKVEFKSENRNILFTCDSVDCIICTYNYLFNNFSTIELHSVS